MKKYILIMGLMTCMCLMATSCKSEDEDDINMTTSKFNDFLGKPGEYSGYWTVFGAKADSCVMTCNGEMITFSKMPVSTILNLLYIYDSLQGGELPTDNIGSYAGTKSINLDNVQIDEKPFTVVANQTGYTGTNTYFSAAELHKIDFGHAVDESLLQYTGLLSSMHYSFGVTNSEGKRWSYCLSFDKENYGVYNTAQKSRIIRFYIKRIGIVFSTDNGEVRADVTNEFDPMWELTFISNDN